jgi:photosystem II stability/assembly factor-like uncharacterized protein
MSVRYISTMFLVASFAACRLQTSAGEDTTVAVDAGAPPDDDHDASAADAGPNGRRPEDPVVPVASGTTVALHAVWMANDGALAIAVGDRGTIVRSTDGGLTWAPSTSGVTVDLGAAWGASATELWVAGKNGTVLRSIDAGGSWKTATLPATTDIVGIWGSSTDQVFFAGANGVVFRTRDHGATFPGRQAPNGLALVGIAGISATELWVAAASNVFHSTDSGETFTPTFANLSPQRAVWAASVEDMYTVNEASIVTRWDGRALFKNLLLRGALSAVWGASANDVYVVGEQGLVRRSIDRNSSWREIAGASGDLLAVGGNASTLLVVGSGGSIFRR